MIINSVPNGEYTMFVEVEDNSGKKYCINLDFKNIQNIRRQHNKRENYTCKNISDNFK